MDFSNAVKALRPMKKQSAPKSDHAALETPSLAPLAAPLAAPQVARVIKPRPAKKSLLAKARTVHRNQLKCQQRDRRAQQQLDQSHAQSRLPAAGYGVPSAHDANSANKTITPIISSRSGKSGKSGKSGVARPVAQPVRSPRGPAAPAKSTVGLGIRKTAASTAPAAPVAPRMPSPPADRALAKVASADDFEFDLDDIDWSDAEAVDLQQQAITIEEVTPQTGPQAADQTSTVDVPRPRSGDQIWGPDLGPTSRHEARRTTHQKAAAAAAAAAAAEATGGGPETGACCRCGGRRGYQRRRVNSVIVVPHPASAVSVSPTCTPFLICVYCLLLWRGPFLLHLPIYFVYY